MEDDLAAIHRLKKGDIGGLEALVVRYQVKAIRAAFLIVRDKQIAEDVVQDVYLRIFKHIDKFEESRPFAPYLYKSVVNTAIDAAQKTSKQQKITVEIESIEEVIEHAMRVETQSEFNEMKQNIFRAFEKLSARQRAVVVMRYYLEMSDNDIAESLNIAPGTIKWHLNAAREHLRQLLGERNIS